MELCKVLYKHFRTRRLQLFARAVPPQDADALHPRIACDVRIRLAVADKGTVGGAYAHGERRVPCERGIGLAGKHSRIPAHKVEEGFGEELSDDALGRVLRLVGDNAKLEPARLEGGKRLKFTRKEAGQGVAACGKRRAELPIAFLDVSGACRQGAFDEFDGAVADIGAGLRVVDGRIAARDEIGRASCRERV